MKTITTLFLIGFLTTACNGTGALEVSPANPEEGAVVVEGHSSEAIFYACRWFDEKYFIKS